MRSARFVVVRLDYWAGNLAFASKRADYAARQSQRHSQTDRCCNDVRAGAEQRLWAHLYDLFDCAFRVAADRMDERADEDC